MHITFFRNLADKGGRIDDSSRTWGQESIVFRMDQERERDLKSKGEKKEGRWTKAPREGRVWF